MGGRGASYSAKSNIGGAKIVFRGEEYTYYFYKTSDGQTRYTNDLGKAPEPTPNGMTAREFLERAKKNGAEVTTFSEQERIRRENEREKERENRPDYELGVGVPWGNKAHRKRARADRLATRVQKRKR